MPKALSDEQYMAINAAFRAFDEDGNSSLSKEEITSILYRISKNQSVAEVDKEAEELMAALDRDKSGQVSYAEFCFAQKNLSNLSALAEKALSKLTGIMILQKNEREKLLAESEENYSRLIHEKETLKETPVEDGELKVLRSKVDYQAQRIAELERELEAKNEDLTKAQQTSAKLRAEKESAESQLQNAKQGGSKAHIYIIPLVFFVIAYYFSRNNCN